MPNTNRRDPACGGCTACEGPNHQNHDRSQTASWATLFMPIVVFLAPVICALVGAGVAGGGLSAQFVGGLIGLAGGVVLASALVKVAFWIREERS